jgi:pimeloyl-ACP methyl ester carboxylesterase
VRDFPAVAGVDVEHRFVEARGLQFHVAEAGGGEPLVLLHGWPQHWWMWRRVLPALADRYRCYVPDLRGLGWSDAPAGGYEKRELAEDVVALLDALGLQKVRLMGHDWGGMVTLLLAQHHPGRLERAIVLDVPPPWDATPDPRRLIGGAHMPFLSSPFGAQLTPFLAERILKMSKLGDDDVREYVEALQPPERRRASASYYRTFLLRELPGAIRMAGRRPEVPLTFIGGAGDPIVRYSRGVDLVPGAGHFLPEDQPEETVSRALAFLG